MPQQSADRGGSLHRNGDRGGRRGAARARYGDARRYRVFEPRAGAGRQPARAFSGGVLLDRTGQNFGQTPWTLFVRALQTNPDSTVEVLPDPDPGNDWTLTLRIVIHEPVITEIAFE